MTGTYRLSPTELPQPKLQLEFKGEVKVFELHADVYTLGRNSANSLTVDQHWKVVSGFHAVLKREGIDYRIYDGDGRGKPSTNGILVNNSRIALDEGFLLSNGAYLTIGANPQDQVLLSYNNPLSSQVTDTGEHQQDQVLLSYNNPLSSRTDIGKHQKDISLSSHHSVYIGRDPQSDFPLDSPLVSRCHAVVEPTAQGHCIRDLGSTNGVFIAGRKIEVEPLLPSTVIRIGPYSLMYQGNKLRLANTEGTLRLDACNLVREVKVKGKARRILNEISLPIEPGQLVALVGGSGAGKSTLMKTLLGVDAATQGAVYLNGDSLRANFNLYRSQLGYVPQDDIVHRELTVTEVLDYATRLRLSTDLSADEAKQVVEQTLADIEMAHCRDNLVYTLSGGQRKRVSIGVELLANPKLFFLDEPTSGLDPGLDKKMMCLLRKLADAGRTIVLVTHATANITLCDRVAFLGRGGHLCYYGPPTEALQFFNLPGGDFADIYNELEQGDVAVTQWKSYFLHSPQYQTYITQQLSPGTANTISPAKSAAPVAPTTTPATGPSALRQFSLLTQRYLRLLLRDRVNLVLALLTAPMGVGLMALTVKRNALTGGSPPGAPLAVRVLFVFTCAAVWVGLSTSLQEIIREAPIYLRERLVNLRLLTYLSSKVVVLGGLAVLQTLLMVLVILLGFESPEGILNWPLGAILTTFLTLLANICLGLAISAFVKNPAQANSALPLILLPQIIFSGVLFDLEGAAKPFSWLMLSRWSVGAYATLVDVNALGWLPGTGSKAAYEATSNNLLLNWGLLLVHTLVYLVVTLWLLKRKDPIT